MSERARSAGAVRFRPLGFLLIIAAGLVFVGLGIGLVVKGFDAVSKVGGIAVAMIGVYVLILGFRLGVVVDGSGITVRKGLSSSTHIPWRDVDSIEVEETEYFILRTCLPVVFLAEVEGREQVSLQSLSYYSIRSGRRSRKVERLSGLLAEYR